MMYAVMSHHIHHLLDIWYDTYDIMSHATAIGGKPPMIASRPIIAIPEVVKGCTPVHWYFQCIKVRTYPFHHDILP